jgi:hypothetical protein
MCLSWLAAISACVSFRNFRNFCFSFLFFNFRFSFSFFVFVFRFRFSFSFSAFRFLLSVFAFRFSLPFFVFRFFLIAPGILKESKYFIVDGTFETTEAKLVLTTILGSRDDIAVPAAYLLSNSKETDTYESFYRVSEHLAAFHSLTYSRSWCKRKAKGCLPQRGLLWISRKHSLRVSCVFSPMRLFAMISFI